MIVHIGFHKTGTTYLQQNFFPKLKGIKYYNYYDSFEALDLIRTQNTIEFDPLLSKSNFDLQEHVLYSYEGMVGEMGKGTYNYEIADRLYKVGFRKVIISIRNQKKMLTSVYSQYIQQGGILKPEDYFNDKNNRFNWSYLNYYKLILRYSQIFGKENVLVILQEDLRKNEEKVFSKLIRFVGAKGINPITNTKESNTSLSFVSLKLLRIINHFTFNYYRRSNLISKRITTWKFRFLLQRYFDPKIFSKVKKNKKIVPETVIKKAEKIYPPQNKKLDKEFNLGLQRYGYY